MSRGEAIGWGAFNLAAIFFLWLIVDGPSWWTLGPAIVLGACLQAAVDAKS